MKKRPSKIQCIQGLIIAVVMAAVILASMANGQTATADAHSITPVECHELLANGDFETGDLPPWAAFGMVGMGPGRESEHGVQLGGADNAGGELLQPVGIPPTASQSQWPLVSIPAEDHSVLLRFWWLAESEIEQPDDAVDIIVQYGEEQADLLHTLRALDPLGQWRMEAVDLSDYAGMEVTLTFLVHTDGEISSTFRLDDISLQACGSEPGPYQPSQPTWEFSGQVIDENDEPFAGMQVRLLGSATPGRAGQLLDWGATNEDGSFLLRVDKYNGDDLGLPNIQVALLHPGWLHHHRRRVSGLSGIRWRAEYSRCARLPRHKPVE